MTRQLNVNRKAYYQKRLRALTKAAPPPPEDDFSDLPPLPEYKPKPPSRNSPDDVFAERYHQSRSDEGLESPRPPMPKPPSLPPRQEPPASNEEDEIHEPSEADLDYAYGTHGGSRVGGDIPPERKLSDQEVLQRAILDDPQDSTPWLVLGDLLEEEGDARKAAMARAIGQLGSGEIDVPATVLDDLADSLGIAANQRAVENGELYRLVLRELPGLREWLRQRPDVAAIFVDEDRIEDILPSGQELGDNWEIEDRGDHWVAGNAARVFNDNADHVGSIDFTVNIPKDNWRDFEIEWNEGDVEEMEAENNAVDEQIEEELWGQVDEHLDYLWESDEVQRFVERKGGPRWSTLDREEKAEWLMDNFSFGRRDRMLRDVASGAMDALIADRAADAGGGGVDVEGIQDSVHEQIHNALRGFFEGDE